MGADGGRGPRCRSRQGRAGRSRQVGAGRDAATLPEQRCSRGQVGCGRRQRPARLQGGVRRAVRGRLVRRFRLARPRGPRLAEDAHRARGGDVLGRQHQPLPVRRAHRRRGHLHCRPCGRRLEERLPAEALQRRMHGRDGAHRIPRRHRSRHDPHPRRTRGRHALRHHRHEDLHHQRRARSGGEHRPPGAGEAAGRARRQPWHLALPGAEVPARRRAQRLRQRRHRTQDGHSRQRHLRHQLRRRRRLSGRRGEPRLGRHVHDDEPRPAFGWHPGPGACRTRLPERGGLRPRALAGPRRQRAAERRWAGGFDPRSPGRAADVVDAAGVHRGWAGAGILRWPDAGSRCPRANAGRTADGASRGGFADAGGEGVSDRPWRGVRVAGAAGVRRARLHRRARRGADRARHPHQPDLRGHQRRAGAGLHRPQGAARWRQDAATAGGGVRQGRSGGRVRRAAARRLRYVGSRWWGIGWGC